MKWIDITHIFKHTKDLAKARAIVNMIRRFTDDKLKHSYGKVTKDNGKVYYTKKKMTSFDIEQTIEDMEKVADNPFQRFKDFDYSFVIDILHKVLKDRLEFKEKAIPDTSDEFEEKYHKEKKAVVVKKKTKKQLEAEEARREEKRNSKKDWIKAFNKTNYGVEKCQKK